jgi:hypothetical protein
MAGQLTIDTLKASSGVLATQNGMTGIAKAWIQYNAATTTIVGSYNVSSVTVIGTGLYQINFTTAMPSTVYAPVGSYNANNSSTGGYALSFYNYLTTSITTAPYPTPGSGGTNISAVVFSS